MRLLNRVPAAVFCLAAALALVTLGGCRIEKRSAVGTSASAADTGSFANANFDPKALVAKIWTSKVLPDLQSRAGELGALRTAMAGNLDAAGAAHGYREPGSNAPWSMATKFRGKIVSVETESSAGQIGVDVDGDGKADVVVQIGPVVRGTAIRDSLSFISFNNYANQIEFAELADAFNKKAYASVLEDLPRDALKGREVEVLGVFTTADGQQMSAVTPVELKLGATP